MSGQHRQRRNLARLRAGTTRYTDCYSIGGCREITADGYIIGSFTDRVQSSAGPTGKCPVYFFKIKVGDLTN